MARITQTFQTIIEGGIAKTLGESTFLVTTSNTLKMDQPWQRRFKNRLFVGPPNEPKLKKYIEDNPNFKIPIVIIDVCTTVTIAPIFWSLQTWISKL